MWYESGESGISKAVIPKLGSPDVLELGVLVQLISGDPSLGTIALKGFVICWASEAIHCAKQCMQKLSTRPNLLNRNVLGKYY